MRVGTLAAVLMIGWGAVAARAAEEMVTHPLYASWAKFPVGTTVTMKTVSEAHGGMAKGTKHDMKKVLKLEAIEPNRVVVSITVEVAGQGGGPIGPAYMEIPAKIEKSRALFYFAPPEVKIANVREGKDRMEVEGKVADVKVQEADFETSSNGSTAKTHVKLWIADGVPGAVVRNVSTTAFGKNDTVSTIITTTLLESEEPGK